MRYLQKRRNFIGIPFCHSCNLQHRAAKSIFAIDICILNQSKESRWQVRMILLNECFRRPAPFSTRSCTIPRCPRCAAMCSGVVVSPSRSDMFTSTPALTSDRTIISSPFFTASCKQETPQSSKLVGFAPCCNRISTKVAFGSMTAVKSAAVRSAGEESIVE
jgi:hypothetical protein